MEVTLSCPWSSFAPGTLRFCETQLCAWIVSPAETWSNLGYLLIGIGLWVYGAKNQDVKARIFGFFAFVVGIFSFLYHMSHIEWLEVLDLGSMLFLGTYLLRENLVRLGWLNKNKKTAFDIVIGATSFFFVAFLDGTDRLYVFGSLITVALWFEALIWVRARRLKQIDLIDYRYLIASLALFVLSYVFWILDFSQIWCSPDNHYWSGHALWHIVNASCFWTLYRFYRQFGNFR